MKKFFFSFLFVFLVSTAQAQEAQLLPKHDLALNYSLFSFYYEEPVMDLTGYLTGPAVSYTHHTDSNIMLHIGAEFLMGETDYDGQYTDGTSLSTDTDDYLWNLRLLAGYDFKVDDSFAVTPYLGLGLRYWNDVIKGTGGYEREISYFYFPLGLETAKVFAETWKWSTRAEYDLFGGGHVKSHLGDAVAGCNTTENEQDQGWGMRLSTSLLKQFEKVAVSLEASYRYWSVEESDKDDLTYYGTKIGYVSEPRNDTQMLGLTLAVHF